MGRGWIQQEQLVQDATPNFTAQPIPFLSDLLQLYRPIADQVCNQEVGKKIFNSSVFGVLVVVLAWLSSMEWQGTGNRINMNLSSS